MEISVSHEQGRVPVTVLRIKGDINRATADQVQAQARQVFEAGARNIVLDLSEVPYMSSAGIRVINDLFNLVRDSAAETDEAMRQGLRDGTYKSPHLKLLNPTRHVQEVLNMAGIDMFLEIYGNLKDAVASF
jgi:anti-sigma B factor antagonist